MAEALRGSYDTYIELATHATLVLVLGMAQPVAPLEQLAHDFAVVVRRMTRPGPSAALTRTTATFEHDTAVAPRDAFLGKGEFVPVNEAAGRISCESIAGYPPGVPALLPGELVTQEVVDYLRALTASSVSFAVCHGS